MGGEEDLDTLKLEDISTLFKAGCVVLLAAFLFHTIGIATNHWAVSVTDAHGTIQYNGLWEKCADVRLGKGDFECQGFIWSDPQVSHWFRYVQTTEVLAFCAMMIMIAFALLYLFAKFITEDHKKNLKVLALVLGFLSGVLIVIACIVFGSLKDVQKPRRMQAASVNLSWSFAFSLIGGLLSIATGVIFTISS